MGSLDILLGEASLNRLCSYSFLFVYLFLVVPGFEFRALTC
jgi:hypothetical protein